MVFEYVWEREREMESVLLHMCLCIHMTYCDNRNRLTRLVMTGPYEMALTQVLNSHHGASQPVMSLLDFISMHCMQIHQMALR